MTIQLSKLLKEKVKALYFRGWSWYLVPILFSFHCCDKISSVNKQQRFVLPHSFQRFTEQVAPLLLGLCVMR